MSVSDLFQCQIIGCVQTVFMQITASIRSVPVSDHCQFQVTVSFRSVQPPDPCSVGGQLAMGSLIGHLLPGFYFFMLASWGFTQEARALAKTTSRYVILYIALPRRGRSTVPLIEMIQAKIDMQCMA